MVFNSSDGIAVVKAIIKTIQDNKAYLSEIDGKIGDGDHGINMNKGFTLAEEKLKGTESLYEGLSILSQTVMEEVGGSMGPLYGIFFEELASKANKEKISAKDFEDMLLAAIEGIQSIGNAKRGDKTLLDTLIPAQEAFSSSLASGKDFADCLHDMKVAAESGWKSTENMVAKVGRASRLGERSRGVLDAGATSCYLILASLADSIAGLLK